MDAEERVEFEQKSAEEKEAQFREWRQDKLDDLTTRIGTAQRLQKMVDSLKAAIQMMPPTLVDIDNYHTRSRLWWLKNQLIAHERMLSTEHNVINDIIKELGLPLVFPYVKPDLADPDDVFWATLLGDSRVQIVGGSVELASALAVGVAAASNPVGWIAGGIAIFGAFRGGDEIGTGVAEMLYGTRLRSITRQSLDTLTEDGEATDRYLFWTDIAITIIDIGNAIRLARLARNGRAFTNPSVWKPPPRGTLFDKAWRDALDDLAKRFDGTVVRGGKPPINPTTGKPIYGTYDPRKNIIRLFDGADDVTHFHELLHWEDIQKAIANGIITRAWLQGIDAATWNRLYLSGEQRVAWIMRFFYGFTPA